MSHDDLRAVLTGFSVVLALGLAAIGTAWVREKRRERRDGRDVESYFSQRGFK